MNESNVLFVFSADTVTGISLSQSICCFSVMTLNRLESMGYQKVNLLKLSDENLSELDPRNNGFLEKIDALVFEISKLMEDNHQMDFKEREWRCLIGLLAYHLLSVSMDRLYRLKQAVKNYPNCLYLAADTQNQEVLIPHLSIDLVELLKTENYNAVIYTKAAEILGLRAIGAVEAPIHNTRFNLQKAQSGRNFFRSLFNKSLGSLFYPIALLRAKVVLQNPYLSKKICLKLFLHSLGQILVLPKNQFSPEDVKINLDLRARILKINPNPQMGSPELINFINALLPWFFPISCLETFSDFHRHALRFFRGHAKVLFTAGGWYFDEQFKHLAALYASSGKLIVSAPHGGGQFVRYFYHVVHHELRLADRYYASGHVPSRLHENAVPISAPKFFYLSHLVKKRNLQSHNKTDLLYGLTSISAFTIELEHPPEFFMDYLVFAQQFIAGLSPELKKNLKIRAHREDLGWNIEKKLQSIGLNETLKFDSWSVPFSESLQQSALYICDHISTTYAEAFMLNHPMVLFFDPEKIMLTKEAEPIFNLFEKIGLFHRTPNSAAQHISVIYEKGIETWWFSEAVQSARNQFCHDFALSSSSAFSDWLNAFRRLY